MVLHGRLAQLRQAPHSPNHSEESHGTRLHSDQFPSKCEYSFGKRSPSSQLPYAILRCLLRECTVLNHQLLYRGAERDALLSTKHYVRPLDKRTTPKSRRHGCPFSRRRRYIQKITGLPLPLSVHVLADGGSIIDCNPPSNPPPRWNRPHRGRTSSGTVAKRRPRGRLELEVSRLCLDNVSYTSLIDAKLFYATIAASRPPVSPPSPIWRRLMPMYPLSEGLPDSPLP